MPESDLLAPDRADRGATASARIVKQPAATTDDLTVALINYSGVYEYEVTAAHWMAGSRLPITGDECLAVFDDDGDVWVPAGAWGAT